MNRRDYKNNLLQKDLEISSVVEQRLQDTYQQIRKNNKKEENIMKKNYLSKIAASIAIIGTVGTLGVGTVFAINGVPDNVKEFFHIPDGVTELFGNTSKSSEEKQTIYVDNGKGSTTKVTLPAVEYIPFDTQLANRIFEGYVSEEAFVQQIKDHTLTIQNYVSDGQSFCAYMTLEREGGVTGMEGSWINNRAKGMSFTNPSEFYFYFCDSQHNSISDKMYLDLEKSTEDKYYITVYGVLDEGENITNAATLAIGSYPTSYKVLPEIKTLKTRILKDGNNVIATYSPISMQIDTSYVYEDAESTDPYFMKYIEIIYKDGSSYVVYNEDEVDNQGYCCGLLSGNYGLTFNRIVDVEQIKQIKINNKTFDVTE